MTPTNAHLTHKNMVFFFPTFFGLIYAILTELFTKI